MSRRCTRSVSLTPILDAFVSRAISTGKYKNVSEVVRDGLRLLMAADASRESGLADLRALIDKGAADADAGRVIPGDAAIRRLKARRANRSVGA